MSRRPWERATLDDGVHETARRLRCRAGVDDRRAAAYGLLAATAATEDRVLRSEVPSGLRNAADWVAAATLDGSGAEPTGLVLDGEMTADVRRASFEMLDSDIPSWAVARDHEPVLDDATDAIGVRASAIPDEAFPETVDVDDLRERVDPDVDYPGAARKEDVRWLDGVYGEGELVRAYETARDFAEVDPDAAETMTTALEPAVAALLLSEDAQVDDKTAVRVRAAVDGVVDARGGEPSEEATEGLGDQSESRYDDPLDAKLGRLRSAANGVVVPASDLPPARALGLDPDHEAAREQLAEAVWAPIEDYGNPQVQVAAALEATTALAERDGIDEGVRELAVDTANEIADAAWTAMRARDDEYAVDDPGRLFRRIATDVSEHDPDRLADTVAAFTDGTDADARYTLPGALDDRDPEVEVGMLRAVSSVSDRTRRAYYSLDEEAFDRADGLSSLLKEGLSDERTDTVEAEETGEPARRDGDEESEGGEGATW